MRRLRYQATSLVALALLAAAPAMSAPIDKIKADGRITFGHREASIPFSYLDGQQKPVGFSIDICMAIVDRLKETLKLPKLDVILQPVTSATRIPLLTNGTIDLECGSTTNTKERQAIVAFSPTTYVATTNFLSKKAKGYNDFTALKGLTVVSTSGTTALKLINQLNTEKQLGLTIISAKDHAEAFLMVETERAAAFVMDDVLIAGLVATSRNPTDYVISKEYLSLEPYGIMFRKDDPELKKAVDEAVAGLMKSGGFDKLYKKWFESPIPPRNVNLNLPMSDLTRKAVANPTASADESAYK